MSASAPLKAVLFTHLKPKEHFRDPADFDRFYKDLGGFFESCVKCDNIAIVFAYVSFGIEHFVRAVGSRARPPITLPFDVIEEEERLYNAFHIAVDEAIDQVPSRPGGPPRFVFIGVRELANLLNKLWRQNPELIKNLAGSGNFTYDSPKFVEAAIRIVRGGMQLEAAHPVIRIDADVEVDQQAIQEILEQAERQNRQALGRPYWWFSGCYKGSFPGDPVNDHAVRQHWLIEPSTRMDPKAFRLLPRADAFLRDLGELGATQVGADFPFSPACQKLIQKRGFSISRQVPQVVSGAGLATSLAAIRRLPPFMNAEEMIVWIDDHLKRQLHEAIGDIPPAACERIETAKLRQNRYPAGITPKDIAFSLPYFERLLGGCLLQAMVKCLDGSPGPLAKCVDAIVNHERNTGQAGLLPDLLAAGQERLQDVLEVWSTADYGDNTLRDWALSLDATAKSSLCERAARVGSSYINILKDWGDYVGAIEKLIPIEAYWLFTRVRA